MAAGEPKAQGREGNSDGDGLHERLYQSGSVQWRCHRNGSEVFHAPDPPFHGVGGHQTSEAGVWSSGRSDSGSRGVSKRRRSFWFVADAQLIVYGATDPAAQLTICGKPVPLSADGTFRLEMAFLDGRQIYPIQAVTAHGMQRRSTTLDFQRRTPWMMGRKGSKRSRTGSEAPQVSRLNCLARFPLLAPDFKHRRSPTGVS